ncbi:hypothetical protein HLG76_12535 [Salinivibrio sp. EAGSL]|jgi:Transposase IS66 family.|uniref:hypothetical protein n=1 Tax=Salinivibrio sp. EAGSL TaxID=2738468 RepID=UPI00158F3A46|nr:hypothetical protein [Salinivibrio sp. EAGSL]NUY57355.1 hypothetical protein [Salinivibrio sp. EAGSL]
MITARGDRQTDPFLVKKRSRSRPGHHPKQVKVLRHECKKRCRHCENHSESSKVIITAMYHKPLPSSVVTAETLATVVVSKYACGLPLYRVEKSWPVRLRAQAHHPRKLNN